MQPHLCGECARRHVMRPAKRRKEVVQRIVIRKIDCCQLEAHLEPVAVEQIVVSDRCVKQISLCNARWIMVVIVRTWRRYPHQCRSKLRSQTCERQCDSRSSPHVAAEESSFKFFIG